MWEDFVKYNSTRTNFLKTFSNHITKAGAQILPLFLQKYEETNSIFEAWLCGLGFLEAERTDKEISVSTLERLYDYKENWWEDTEIKKYLRLMFPDMITSGYNIKSLEKDVPNFSPLSIEEFYLVTKGKYYVGYDLDEDLGKMINYVKNQDLVEMYINQITDYFEFRYNNFDLNVLCEYNAFPFGVHESRRLQYKKKGQLVFDYPREMYKYDVKSMIENYLNPDVTTSGTRIINIRGTNGSGKTTMVNHIYLDSVAKDSAEEHTMVLTDKKGKDHKRYYDLLKDKGVILLGGYNTPYGTKGTDRIGDAHEIIQGILYLVSNYPGWTIIMESATVSTSFWGYALLYTMLQNKGVEINIVHLWMTDWDFIVNNIKNRTNRKPGSKEPDYQGAIDKREILYKNHFRFSSIIGRENMFVMYPNTVGKDHMHILLDGIIKTKNGRGIL